MERRTGQGADPRPVLLQVLEQREQGQDRPGEGRRGDFGQMKYTVGGKDYELAFTVHTMELLEEEFGDVQAATDGFRKGRKSMKAVKGMFRAMANAGRKLRGLPEDVTGEEIDGLTLKGLDILSRTMTLVMDESLKTETTGGMEADDEKYDLVLAELDAKNARAGGGSGASARSSCEGNSGAFGKRLIGRE